ncbi:MAG: ATP-binding cassette domain-containing protein, partial [Chthonomonas sp.]|nr:ATP-binding cassette domain-containing protein [Chthonomonas sp.]
ILFGKPDATRQDVEEACRAAHAQFVFDMPNGLETTLGERGVRLSGGEAQRISIARAFVRKPGLLLLDEATSNLDAVSEKAVQEALNEIMTGRTTVTIAHRLSTAARCTKVLMLRRGEVVEFGSFADLMAASGPFASMYRAYSEGLIDASIG